MASKCDDHTGDLRLVNCIQITLVLFKTIKKDIKMLKSDF